MISSLKPEHVTNDTTKQLLCFDQLLACILVPESACIWIAGKVEGKSQWFVSWPSKERLCAFRLNYS